MPHEMIAFAHWVQQAFVPSLALGVVLAIAWRYVERGAVRTALQWIAALLFFVPQPFALFLGSYSSGLRLYQQVLLALWGGGVGVLLIRRLRSRPQEPIGDPGLGRRLVDWRQTEEEVRRTRELLARVRTLRPPEKPHSKPALALGAVAMIGLGIFSAWTAVGDYGLHHDRVAGRVEGARVIRNTRSPNTYQVIIGHRRYGITRDLLAQMYPGDSVEVEVGVASGTIVALQRDDHPHP